MARLIVTTHALEKHRERWHSGLDDTELKRLILHEVYEAIIAGRTSTKLPRWAVKPGSDNRKLLRNGTERDRTLRVVWTDDRTRCYLIDKRGDFLRVVTSIRPQDDDRQLR